MRSVKRDESISWVIIYSYQICVHQAFCKAPTLISLMFTAYEDTRADLEGAHRARAPLKFFKIRFFIIILYKGTSNIEYNSKNVFNIYVYTIMIVF